MITHTIVVTTKDRPVMLRRAVASALASKATDGEVLVVDDHSVIPAWTVLTDFDDARLRIIKTPRGREGISGTRSLGFEQARGKVLFFLDDDDEILPDYCGNVLLRGAGKADYGFSAYLEGSCGKTSRATVRFSDGLIPTNAPLRKRLCGFGMGFWIHRVVAQDMGPVDSALTMNEDTDYLCRLISAGKGGWYSASPGVIVHRHDQGGSEAHHVTKRTSAIERARCMLLLCDRYPQMVAHLGAGYIRHCLKMGATEAARSFIRKQPDWQTRLRLGWVFGTKRAAYLLAGLRSA
jgi:glycosyltransferase involved in cell wall biosynthesis